jgi:hypothetical protein
VKRDWILTAVKSDDFYLMIIFSHWVMPMLLQADQFECGVLTATSAKQTNVSSKYSLLLKDKRLLLFSDRSLSFASDIKFCIILTSSNCLGHGADITKLTFCLRVTARTVKISHNPALERVIILKWISYHILF